MVLRQLFDLRREVELIEHGDLGNDPPHGDREFLAAVKDAGSEARHARDVVGDVDRPLMLKQMSLFRRLALRVDDGVYVLLHDVVAGGRTVEEARAAIDADHRRAARLKVQVRAVGLHYRLQKIHQRESPLLDVDGGLRRVAVNVGVLNDRRRFGGGGGHNDPSV